MNDRIDAVFSDNSPDKGLIPDIALNKFRFPGQRRQEAGRQVIDDYNLFPAFKQREHTVASDITCAPRYNDRHNSLPSL